MAPLQAGTIPPLLMVFYFPEDRTSIKSKHSSAIIPASDSLKMIPWKFVETENVKTF